MARPLAGRKPTGQAAAAVAPAAGAAAAEPAEAAGGGPPRVARWRPPLCRAADPRPVPSLGCPACRRPPLPAPRPLAPPLPLPTGGATETRPSSASPRPPRKPGCGAPPHSTCSTAPRMRATMSLQCRRPNGVTCTVTDSSVHVELLSSPASQDTPALRAVAHDRHCDGGEEVITTSRGSRHSGAAPRLLSSACLQSMQDASPRFVPQDVPDDVRGAVGVPAQQRGRRPRYANRMRRSPRDEHVHQRPRSAARAGRLGCRRLPDLEGTGGGRAGGGSGTAPSHPPGAAGQHAHQERVARRSHAADREGGHSLPR